MKTRPPLLAMALLLATGAAQAQDTRPVVEPTLPPACAVLIAERSAPEPETPTDDTTRIQAAIDHCGAGRSVRLAASNQYGAFLAGPLTLASGVTLVVEGGATLYASRDPARFDRGGKSCGTTGAKGHGCKTFITATDTAGSGIMGDGVIDGQGGQTIVGGSESWWEIARRAQRENSEHNVPRLIEVEHSREFTLYRITLRNSPNFHVTLHQVDGVTAWGVHIDTPATARNTDGIDPVSSRNVTITHSFIRTGDDDVAIKAGDNGPSENISIVANHFYSGHGMSIGSETQGGVHHVLVQDLSLDGTVSGLRIKSDVSRGGPVDDVNYRDICLRGVHAPIDISTDYTKGAHGTRVPVYERIAFENVHSLTAGNLIIEGHDAEHPVRARFDQVQVDGLPRFQVGHAELTPSPDFINGGTGAPLDCSQRFPAFPAKATASAPRPQLSAAEAAHYAYAEVLGHAGAPGHEGVDRWDPLSEQTLPAQPDYTVDAHATPDGRHVFANVQAAVNQAVVDARGAAAGKRLFILVRPGVYRELVYVPPSTSAITLYGEGHDPAATVITASLDAAVSGADYARQYAAQFAGTDPSIQAMFDALKSRPSLSTFGTYTVWVRNAGFQAFNLTFENAYRRVAEAPCVEDCHAMPQPHQAVALAVDGADRAQFVNVRLLGLQDTLYLKTQDGGRTARSFFDRAYIEGDVDFIFGDATAFFYRSEIRSLGSRPNSYVGAPDTNLLSAYGLVFDHCTFSNDGSAFARLGAYKLARQWFHNQKCTPYRAMAIAGYACSVGNANDFDGTRGHVDRAVLETVGKMVVLNSRIGGHIDKTHPWADWNQSGKLSYRPAQLDSDGYFANLIAIGIDPVRQLGYGGKPTPAATFLAEYNNTQD